MNLLHGLGISASHIWQFSYFTCSWHTRTEISWLNFSQASYF